LAWFIELLQSSGSTETTIPGGVKGACDDTIEAMLSKAEMWQA